MALVKCEDPQSSHKWRPACNPSLGKQKRVIPRASWQARRAVVVSSGFHWQSLSQWMMWNSNRGWFLTSTQASTYIFTHMPTNMQKHTCTYLQTIHTHTHKKWKKKKKPKHFFFSIVPTLSTVDNISASHSRYISSTCLSPPSHRSLAAWDEFLSCWSVHWMVRNTQGLLGDRIRIGPLSLPPKRSMFNPSIRGMEKNLLTLMGSTQVTRSKIWFHNS